MPWCVRKCPYCDFNSHALDDPAQLPEQAYLAALRADLESTLADVWGRVVHSVFIGGGTPSLFSGAAIDTLLSDVRARVPLAADCEITLEANPGTFEAGRYAQFRAAGVNRLSIGVQSFDDAKLRALGRVHDGAQARRAIDAAQAAFDNVNLDLMIGLPGQHLEQACDDVETALGHGPAHLSIYQLTLEPNTVFHKFPPALPDEDTLAAMQVAVDERLDAAGFVHYEVSAYARPGRACVHNRNYWSFGDYLGIGAGAHAKLCLPGRIVRTERFRMPSTYLENAAQGRFVAAERSLDAADLVFEFMLNALRLREGFAPELFVQRTGLPPSALEPGLHRARQRGLIAQRTDRIVATDLGMRFLNDLQQIFLPDPVRATGGD